MSSAAQSSTSTRRQFLGRIAQGGGALMAGSAVLGKAASGVHLADDHTIRLALIGAGGRGTGAVVNALKTANQGPIELYAMADLHLGPMESKLKSIKEKYPDKANVTPDRMFLGFDAYKKAIDVLRPGDVAMCTTRAYIRPIHVEYAVKRGVNVFMEKPFASDPMGLHRMLRAAEEADTKGVKILCGLQCRHSPARAALIEKIQRGAIGEMSYIRANRLTGRGWMGNQGDRSNQLLGQLSFGRASLYWIGSGHMVDNLIHQIDECCWLMDDWPVHCHGMGGREVGSKDHGQNNDIYSMEYTFPDGRKAFCGFRRAKDGKGDFATYVHGSKKTAQFSGNVHKATVHIFKDHRISTRNIEWTPTEDAHSPWDYEWIDFIAAIRNDLPFNEGKRAVYADYASLMGRAAAHLNRTVTWDEVTSSQFQFCDYLDDLTMDSPAPVLADAEGFFPAPAVPGWVEL